MARPAPDYPTPTGLLKGKTVLITAAAGSGIGGAVVSDNITVEHVLNVKRLAYHLNPPPDVARAHGGRLEGMDAAATDDTPDDSSATPASKPANVGAGGDAALIEKVVRQILTELNK